MNPDFANTSFAIEETLTRGFTITTPYGDRACGPVEVTGRLILSPTLQLVGVEFDASFDENVWGYVDERCEAVRKDGRWFYDAIKEEERKPLADRIAYGLDSLLKHLGIVPPENERMDAFQAELDEYLAEVKAEGGFCP